MLSSLVFTEETKNIPVTVSEPTKVLLELSLEEAQTLFIMTGCVYAVSVGDYTYSIYKKLRDLGLNSSFRPLFKDVNELKPLDKSDMMIRDEVENFKSKHRKILK